MRRYAYTPNVMVEQPDGGWIHFEDVEKELGTKCARCGTRTKDIRTLYMACGYEMSELNIPFGLENVPAIPGFNRGQLFTLKVCKDCRSKWMTAIEDWFRPFRKENKDED